MQYHFQFPSISNDVFDKLKKRRHNFVDKSSDKLLPETEAANKVTCTEPVLKCRLLRIQRYHETQEQGTHLEIFVTQSNFTFMTA